ncbi:TolC family protein [Botrimarina hoheduenensis]|uniref:Outer membrane efflux protein n=1 Tax=Botrimarina hoheduenensis TaxID=2528000 RepID=A0A5C5W9F7_9BACT|nr:TolC family protein [Botrimarina hoheduenensis]TWT47508.1 Outer membrane efflux protein [Botrimarina hoheduenensis]
MDRQTRSSVSLLLALVMVATGCAPTQPFYFMEDGDLSHYVDVATQIEYPDVEEPQLDEVSGAMRPLTLRNAEDYEVWDLTLEEATRITLTNSQVMRQLGGAVLDNAPETLSRNQINNVAVTTTYDPALVETSTGTAVGSQFSGTGVEAALSEFDAQLDSAVTWNRNDRPQNVRVGDPTIEGFQPSLFAQDLGAFNLGVSKTSATGGQYAFRNNTAYDYNNAGIREAPSSWNTNFEAFISQPLLQGRGAQYNRIAGPFGFDQYAQGGTNPFDGVMLARIRTDQTLADFEGGVRNLMRDVEEAYWELYFAYRDLDARKLGRDSALETWKKVAALYREGARGGSADREAQSRAQYFQFKAQVEEGLTTLFARENRLRYMMGLSVSDGRLIRPADEPTSALVSFDWSSVHPEALVRRVEIRKQKWEVKRRELELIAARNHLLPRLDAFGTYRWLGAGDRLFQQNPVAPAGGLFRDGTGAFDSLTEGDFEEWEMGFRFSLPIGFRRELSTVRHHQLLLARDRAILQDLELEVSHQLGESIRFLDSSYTTSETNFNRRTAAEREVEAVQAQYDANRVTLDLLLDAQRRRSDAETAYYRSLVNYNVAISRVHYRKGSLLDYNGVYLAEGPWPGKAHFDALRRARQRDASLFLDYGYTRPGVMSRGAHAQQMDYTGAEVSPTPAGELYYEGVPTPAGEPTLMEGAGELLQPIPAGEPLGALRQPLFSAPGAMAVVGDVVPVGYDDADETPAAITGHPTMMTRHSGVVLTGSVVANRAAGSQSDSFPVQQAIATSPQADEHQPRHSIAPAVANAPVGNRSGR